MATTALLSFPVRKGENLATKKQLNFLDRLSKQGWQDSYTGIILAIVIVIIAGLLIFNYFGTKNSQIDQNGATDQDQNSGQQPEKTDQGQQGGVPTIQTPAQYTVTKGDFIVKLTVQAYGDSNLWPAVAKANNLIKPSEIEVGQKINLPAKDQLPQATVADLRTTGYDKIDGTSYAVDYGDTLANIAQRAYGDAGKWVQIDQANHLGRLPNNNPLIHSGNILVIPR